MKVHWLYLALSIALLSSCIESDNKYYINPDGTGKLEFRAQMPLNPFGNSDPETIEEEAKKEFVGFISEINGIDAWKGLNWRLSEDSSSLIITGMGYFRDMNALGGENLFLRPLLIEQEDGTTLVKMASDDKDEMESEENEDVVIAEDEDFFKDKILENKKTFKFMKNMMSLIFADMRFSTTMQFSPMAKVQSMQSVSVGKENSFTFAFEGMQIVNGLDSLEKSEEFWEEMAKKNKSLDADEGMEDITESEAMKNFIFPDGEPQLVFENLGSAVFDFEAELAEALEEWESIKDMFTSYDPDGEYMVFSSEDGLTSINVPPGWEEIELNDDASIEIGDESQEIYCILISEAKVDFDNITLDEYFHLIFDNFTLSLENMDYDEIDETTVNGYDAYQVELRGTIDKVKISYIYTCLESETHFHSIYLWSYQSKFDKYRETFYEIADSFREK